MSHQDANRAGDGRRLGDDLVARHRGIIPTRGGDSLHERYGGPAPLLAVVHNLLVNAVAARNRAAGRIHVDDQALDRRVLPGGLDLTANVFRLLAVNDSPHGDHHNLGVAGTLAHDGFLIEPALPGGDKGRQAKQQEEKSYVGQHGQAKEYAHEDPPDADPPARGLVSRIRWVRPRRLRRTGLRVFVRFVQGRLRVIVPFEIHVQLLDKTGVL